MRIDFGTNRQTPKCAHQGNLSLEMGSYLYELENVSITSTFGDFDGDMDLDLLMTGYRIDNTPTIYDGSKIWW